MNKKKVYCVIKSDGTLSTKKKHDEEYLAELSEVKNIQFLFIRIPAKIKGIVRSILLHYIYDTITKKCKYKYYRSARPIDVIKEEFEVDDDLMNCFTAFDVHDIFEYLYEFIKEFDCKIYNEKC